MCPVESGQELVPPEITGYLKGTGLYLAKRSGKSFIHSYLITPMLDPCEGTVVDLPQVFVSACWAPRTITEDVVHGLTLLAAGTLTVGSNVISSSFLLDTNLLPSSHCPIYESDVQLSSRLE